MTRYGHTTHYNTNVDRAILDKTPIAAICGFTFVPEFNGGQADEFPECPDCRALDIRGRIRPGDLQPHLVYRCYDSADRLIYVGCTFSPLQRMDQHRLGTWWYPQVARIRYIVFPDKLYALAKEREAIATENPRWNIRGRDRTLWSLDDYADCYTAMRESGSEKKAEQLAVQAFRRFGSDVRERWSA